MNLTAIIELTENCNLECSFCLRPSFNHPTMSKEILSRIIGYVIDNSEKRADFIWHGGEPLLAGLDLFRKIPRIQKEANAKRIFINNNVQTNGTLINQEYAKFFKENEFQVGTSIQGTKEIHDTSRVDKRGKPTFERILEKISLLYDKPSTIVVLTKDLLEKESKVYETAKKHACGMRISECFPSKKIDKLIDPIKYGRSLVKFYELWKSDPNPIELRPITEIIRSFVFGRSESCLYSQEACTNSVIGIKANGDFYTCIRGAPHDSFLLGNVRKEPLKYHTKRAKKDKTSRLEALQKDCGQCEYWNICNGGCPLESWSLHGDLEHKTNYCEGRKLLFEHIKKDLKIE